MTSLSAAFQSIVALIQTSDRFVICSHEAPEGDCLGAALGLYFALRRLGREAWLYNPDEIPDQYQFLPGIDLFSRELPTGPLGAAFVVDCGGLDRIGPAASVLRDRCPIVNLDHHVTNARFGDLNFVAPDMSSSGELIYHLLQEIPVPLDRDIATVLYTAIVTDTGSFRYSNTSVRTFDVARDLVAHGADPAEVAIGLYESWRPARLQLLQRILESLELSPDGRWACVRLTKEMLASTGATSADLDGLINYPRSIRGVDVAVMLRESDRGVNVSLRGKGAVDLSAIALRFGGGGHRNAAGFSLSGTLDDAAGIVRGEVLRALYGAQETS